MDVPVALVGCQVWRTAFDYQVRLTLVAQRPDGGCRVDAELVVESPFLLRDAHGAAHELEPGSGARLAPVIDLFMKTVTAVEIRELGALALAFDDGSELVVGVDPDFESWQLTGLGAEDVVVGPGGEA